MVGCGEKATCIGLPVKPGTIFAAENKLLVGLVLCDGGHLGYQRSCLETY